MLVSSDRIFNLWPQTLQGRSQRWCKRLCSKLCCSPSLIFLSSSRLAGTISHNPPDAFNLIKDIIQYYRSLPLSLKALGVITITVPVCVAKAEIDGNAWERTQWRDAGKMEMEHIERSEQERIARLSTKEKVMNWAAERRSALSFIRCPLRRKLRSLTEYVDTQLWVLAGH